MRNKRTSHIPLYAKAGLFLIAISFPLQANAWGYKDSDNPITLGCRQLQTIKEITEAKAAGKNQRERILSEMADGQCQYIDFLARGREEKEGDYRRITENYGTIKWWIFEGPDDAYYAPR